MTSKDGLRLLVMVVWSILCVLAAVQGFKGLLAPFYAGLGWIILAVLSIGLAYAYYKINKMLTDLAIAFETAKQEIEQMGKQDD